MSNLKEYTKIPIIWYCHNMDNVVPLQLKSQILYNS